MRSCFLLVIRRQWHNYLDTWF